MNSRDDLDFVLAAAAWQDDLLQSYRSLHLTFQSIMLAIGVGLLVAIVAMAWGVQFFASCGLLVLVWVLQRFAAVRFKKVILARG